MIFAVARTRAVPKLPTLALPDTLIVPLATNPVVVAVNLAVVFPATYNVMFALEVIDTLLLPFARGPIKLPELVLPVTVKLVKVPVLVMFGCAAVVNVPVNKVALKLPVAALNVRFAFAPCVKLPDVAFTNIG